MTKYKTIDGEVFASFRIGTDEPAQSILIPAPPAGMFTDAEWAAIQRWRAIREANGTHRVGDDY